jgi:hypothetical protein
LAKHFLGPEFFNSPEGVEKIYFARKWGKLANIIKVLNLYSFRPLHPLREESTVEARSRSFSGTILSERENN